MSCVTRRSNGTSSRTAESSTYTSTFGGVRQHVGDTEAGLLGHRLRLRDVVRLGDRSSTAGKADCPVIEPMAPRSRRRESIRVVSTRVDFDDSPFLSRVVPGRSVAGGFVERKNRSRAGSAVPKASVRPGDILPRLKSWASHAHQRAVRWSLRVSDPTNRWECQAPVTPIPQGTRGYLIILRRSASTGLLV